VARCGANEQGRHVARALTFAFAAFIGFVGINSAKDYTDRCPAEIETPRGTIRTVPALVDDFRSFFSFFEARLSPSRHFYVYPYGPGYNFLVGHPSVAPYPAIFPHRPTLTTPEQFAEVLSALQQEQIQFVVVPFTYRAMLGNSDLELERYILTHYRVLNEGARTLILERNRVDKKGRKISPRRGFAQ
jgi:hypothetical protein